MKVLLIINGPAYGFDETFNAIRLATRAAPGSPPATHMTEATRATGATMNTVRGTHPSRSKAITNAVPGRSDGREPAGTPPH